MVQRVAIVGGGCTGLVCLKSCLEEGLQPVCFESSDDIGGLWKIKSGQWNVVTVNIDGQELRHVFDAVLMCSGQYTQPILPVTDFPGHETFSGRCYHSWEYKTPDVFRGKRVAVVGIGHSGGDICAEISRSAEKTFLSIRNGAWVLSRLYSSGLPLDMITVTRFNNILMHLLPKALINWAVERALNQRCDHRLYGLMPKQRFLDKRPLVNDDLPARILQGAIVVKPNLHGFQGSGLMFSDNTVEENIDAVVFCTGYTSSFPFLPPSPLEEPGGEVTLYKNLFPPLEHPTLAIMGLFQTKGPNMPIIEMQARWATKAIAGSCHLPPKETMLTTIEIDKKNCMKRFPGLKQAAIQVDYIPYLDFIANEIGVGPNILALLVKDPVLGLKVLLGPCTPYQYRLTGPGRWAGSREAILTQWERVAQPFKTRVVPELETSATALIFSWLLTLSGGVVMLAMLSCQDARSLLLDWLNGFF